MSVTRVSIQVGKLLAKHRQHGEDNAGWLVVGDLALSPSAPAYFVPQQREGTRLFSFSSSSSSSWSFV